MHSQCFTLGNPRDPRHKAEGSGPWRCVAWRQQVSPVSPYLGDMGSRNGDTKMIENEWFIE